MFQPARAEPVAASRVQRGDLIARHRTKTVTYLRILGGIFFAPFLACIPVCPSDIDAAPSVSFLGAFDDYTGDAGIGGKENGTLTFTTLDDTRDIVVPLQDSDDIAIGQRGTFLQRASWVQFGDSDGLIIEIVAGSEGALREPNMFVSDDEVGTACTVRSGRVRQPVLVQAGTDALSEPVSGDAATSSEMTIGTNRYRFVVFTAAKIDDSTFARAMLVRQRD